VHDALVVALLVPTRQAFQSVGWRGRIGRDRAAATGHAAAERVLGEIHAGLDLDKWDAGCAGLAGGDGGQGLQRHADTESYGHMHRAILL